MATRNNNNSPLKIKDIKPELPVRLSGLSRAHRIIRTAQSRELQFMVLCAQIRLDDFRKSRADRQRNDRREKRIRKELVD